MVAERDPRTGSKQKTSKLPGDGKGIWRTAGPPDAAKQRKIEAAAEGAIARARILCASEYWAWEVTHRGEGQYAPNQRCRCQSCMAASPERKTRTTKGLSLIPGGRLWPRQAFAVIRIHYECRQIELAPAERRNPATAWKRRRTPRQDDSAWVASERGCWRRCGLFCDDAEALREVRVRQGESRRMVGIEQTSVVAAEERNRYVVMFEQVNDPDLLAELNGICAESGDSGLLDMLESLQSEKSGLLIPPTGKHRGRTGKAWEADEEEDSGKVA